MSHTSKKRHDVTIPGVCHNCKAFARIHPGVVGKEHKKCRGIKGARWQQATGKASS